MSLMGFSLALNGLPFCFVFVSMSLCIPLYSLQGFSESSQMVVCMYAPTEMKITDRFGKKEIQTRQILYEERNQKHEE